MAATVPVVGVRALLSAFDRLGLDRVALLAEVELADAPLDDPEGRVPTVQADALWAAAYRISGDERLAMRAVQQLRAGDYRTLAYLAAHCPTVGEGVRRILGFFDLVDRRIRWSLDEDAEPVVLRLQFDGVPEPLPRPPVEYTLGAFLVSLRLTTRVRLRPLRVEVGFPKPRAEAAEEHERVLGPMAYGCTQTRLLVSRPQWRQRVDGADRALADMLEDLAARRLRELPAPTDLREQLHDAIREQLVGGAPSLEAVARQLGMSKRSLQRRLTEAGGSFRAEVEAVRQTLATLMLEDPNLALSEIAWLLGFSDPRAFTRAFRRWHGQAPSAWRRSSR